MATGINPASMFGGGGVMTPQMGMQPPQQGIQPGQQGPKPSSGQASAAQQLLEQVAHINSLLKQLATTTPEMSKAVEAALEALKGGMVKTTSGMLSKQGEESQPAYA